MRTRASPYGAGTPIASIPCWPAVGSSKYYEHASDSQKVHKVPLVQHGDLAPPLKRHKQLRRLLCRRPLCLLLELAKPVDGGAVPSPQRVQVEEAGLIKTVHCLVDRIELVGVCGQAARAKRIQSYLGHVDRDDHERKVVPLTPRLCKDGRQQRWQALGEVQELQRSEHASAAQVGRRVCALKANGIPMVAVPWRRALLLGERAIARGKHALVHRARVHSQTSQAHHPVALPAQLGRLEPGPQRRYHALQQRRVGPVLAHDSTELVRQVRLLEQ
mmetsp:Transcript_22620/g.73146  ORF Transcript_22620/g.73146 Transcript_22620/m.73146 type:complete len:274 (+) Transcript_22620:574-1395(+)